jgi:hypothetical protein
MSRARWDRHLFTDSKVALRDAVARPSQRLSAWKLPDLPSCMNLFPFLRPEVAKIVYERQCDSGSVALTAGTILKKLLFDLLGANAASAAPTLQLVVAE